MKKLSENLQSHLAGECTTLCNCWQIFTADGNILGFTDHDETLHFDNIDHEASTGFEASQIENTNGLTPDNHEIVGALNSDVLTPDDIAARKYDDSQVKHYVVNWQSPEERVLMQCYIIGEIVQKDGVFSAELKSALSKLDQTIFRRFEKRCNADLGDEKCQVNLQSAYIAAGQITQIVSDNLIKVSGIDGFENGWFTSGKIIFSTGQNQGQKIRVANHRNSNLTPVISIIELWEKPIHPINIGDQFSIQAGCDKNFLTCKNKFANAKNFRGFPHMPGTDFALSYASNSEQMDGGAIVE